jgi:alpha-1,2-mannosyltransferase
MTHRRVWNALYWVVLVAVNIGVVLFFLVARTTHGFSFSSYRIDLDVYRMGSRLWLRGGDPYRNLLTTAQGARLWYTYPPIAVVLLVPLTVVPMWVSGVLLTVASIAALAVTLAAFGVRGWPLLCVLPVALFLEPMWSTIDYGQINALLMVLVAVDCLAAAPRWPRGCLVGLAAAVKLTPGLFVLYFLLRRDYRAAATSAVSFAAATALGFALAPGESVRYWTHDVFDTGRIGNPVYASNESILAVIERAGMRPGAMTTVVWLALSGVVLAVACRGMLRSLDAGQPRLALVLNAFAALLISPISWSHHWVWAIPALVTLACARSVRLRLAAAAGVVIFFLAPQWWFPNGGQRELRWAVWQQIVGSSYVIFAVIVMLLAVWIALPRRASPDIASTAAPAVGLGGVAARSGVATCVSRIRQCSVKRRLACFQVLGREGARRGRLTGPSRRVTSG